MKLTNIHGLPSALFSAVVADDYDRGDAEISVTELIDAPRIRLMHEVYGEQVERDISEMAPSILGSAFHLLMQREAEPDDLLNETRLFGERQGWRYSGQIDRLKRDSKNHLHLTDWKVTTVSGARVNMESWEKQLNIYASLVEEHFGQSPKSMHVTVLMRDWSAMRTQKQAAGYPRSAIESIPVARWPRNKTLAYIDERLTEHQLAQQLYDTEGKIVECSKEERWEAPSKWAVYPKKGTMQRATKVFDTEAEADTAVRLNTHLSNPMVKVERRGERVRCENFCQFAPFCEQLKALRTMDAAEDALKALEWDKQ